MHRNSRKFKIGPPYHLLCEMQSTGVWFGSYGEHPMQSISHQSHIIIKNENFPLSHFALHMRQGCNISLRQILTALPAPNSSKKR